MKGFTEGELLNGNLLCFNVILQEFDLKENKSLLGQPRNMQDCLSGKQKTSQKLAIDVLKNTVEHNFILDAHWIPRTENGKADFLSKFIDINDWQINPSTFILIDAKWGTNTVDRFAIITFDIIITSKYLDLIQGLPVLGPKLLTHLYKTGAMIITGSTHPHLLFRGF